MALRNANNNATSLFESQDESQGEVTAASVIDKAQEEAKATGTAVAAIDKARTAVGAVRPRMQAAYNDFQDVITTEEVQSLGVGAFPRVTIDLGGFTLDKEELGTEIKLDLISWNNRWMITTGAQDDESKKKVKVSHDNETISDTGETIREVLEQFREDGYTKAACKGYIDLWGMLTFAKGKDIEADDRQMVQIQLSPESVKKFRAFQVETGVKKLSSSDPLPSTIVLRSKRGEFGGNRFGYCVFSMK